MLGPDILFGLLVLVLMLGFSASFSSFETALFSLTPVQRYRLSKSKTGFSSLISRVIEKPREFLITVLFGNELMNVAIAILAGSLAYDILENYSQKTIYLVSTGVTTFVLLVFGEILPKNIAVRAPGVVSRVLIVPYLIFSWVVFPFRILLTKITDFLLRILGLAQGSGRRLIVEEELRALLDLGQKEGTLASLESNLIQSALDFSDLHVFSVMTPRERIVSLSADTSLQAALESLRETRYSRIPVYEGRLDNVIGILYAKELLAFRRQNSDDSAFSLKKILKPHIEVSLDDTLDQVFQRFRQTRVHMAIVKETTGPVRGLVTLDDLLSQFFS